MYYKDKRGNSITVQDNGLIDITPKNDSTRFYDLKEIVQALKKQIASKIIFNSEEDREYEDYICPNCKDILQQRRKGAKAITIYKYKYCHNCGQKLDWRATHDHN